MELAFNLDQEFVESYREVKPKFGFNGLGELVYKRTYSRLKPDGTNEEWFETVARVVNGIYSLQKEHIEKYNLGWDEERAQRSAKEMYRRIFEFKFTPPGRGLWVMGTPVIHEKKMGMAANNCAFTSTEFMDMEDPTFPFTFLMNASMQGTGVGFDLKGAGKIDIHKPNKDRPKHFSVPDTREGWVESVKVLLESYFYPNRGEVKMDYSKVRPAGQPIKTFGGVSSGPAPLKELHKRIRKYLNKNVGKPITERSIIDIQNAIGCAVVAGNVRRSAEIVFGTMDTDYMNFKDYEKYPERMEIGWASNNSVFVNAGDDYKRIEQSIIKTAEPGVEWLQHARDYGRMCEAPNYKDSRASGGNPCLEQTLEHGEVCCLVETYPYNHDSLDDFLTTLKYAYLYAKTVTLIPTDVPETNKVVFRNRRVGTSMSGIAQFVESHGLHELKQWCDRGYEAITAWDRTYSEWFGIKESIKLTSVKPSGTVSLLAGATPGLHYPHSRFYIRRMRIANGSPLLDGIREAGYHVEPDQMQPETTSVVEFPVDCGIDRTLKDVGIWEQVALAAFMQKYWADNQVSCTVSFDPETEGDQIAKTLDYFQYDLKGISFLPKSKDVYPQMPYEEITEEEYNEMLSKIKGLELASGEDGAMEKFCDGDSCTI